ncbi:MAG: hypothetical protein ABSB10_06160 [Candidatus Bathyarchaeia archaeon]
MEKEGANLNRLRHSAQPFADGSREGRVEEQKKLVEELKVQWKLLWSERFDDKVRAEGVSVSDYVSLRVERGTIIHATRDFKALSFKEILEQHLVEDIDRFVQPEVHVGGWNKFIKTEITGRRHQSDKRVASSVPEKRVVQQPKKGGRGWLHVT